MKFPLYARLIGYKVREFDCRAIYTDCGYSHRLSTTCALCLTVLVTANVKFPHFSEFPFMWYQDMSDVLHGYKVHCSLGQSVLKYIPFVREYLGVLLFSEIAQFSVTSIEAKGI